MAIVDLSLLAAPDVVDELDYETILAERKATLVSLYLYPGPESEPIRAAAVKKLEGYISAQHRLGRDIRLSAIYAALHVEGVQRVELAAPVADLVLSSAQASFCTDYSIVIGGSDE